ncbi:CTP synthase (UTP-ammonia lyase), partial [Trachipleistophora hominis]
VFVHVCYKKNKNGAPMKYVIVAGGTLSGIGKGITLSSIGLILRTAGMKVIPVKIDPYLNKSCGTISPLDHGEVFVLEDGCEADMDLGFYERIMDVLCCEMSCITGGKVYRRMIARENAGMYFGETMEVVPHVNAVVEDMIHDRVRMEYACYEGLDCVVAGGILGVNREMEEEGRAKKIKVNNGTDRRMITGRCGNVDSCGNRKVNNAVCRGTYDNNGVQTDSDVEMDAAADEMLVDDDQFVSHKQINEKNLNKRLSSSIINAMHKTKAYKTINTDDVVVLVEVGGVIDDKENDIFSSTLSHIKQKCAKEDFLVVSVDYMPSFSNSEQKTKLIQRSVQKFISRDLKPDIVVCRGPNAFFKGTKGKIVAKTGVRNVFSSKDTSMVYEIPFDLQAQGMREALLSSLNIGDRHVFKIENKLSWVFNDKKYPITVAMVIKYNGNDDSYVSVIDALKVCALMMNIDLSIKTVDSETIEKETDALPDGDVNAVLGRIFSGCDCILVPGGFGMRGTEGKISAINYARTNRIPFLGICLGFQLSVIEFCRNVLGLKDATSEEFDSTSMTKVVMVMEDHKIEKIVSGRMRLGSKHTYLVDSMVKDAYSADYRRAYLYCEGQEHCSHNGEQCSDEYNTGSASLSASECIAVRNAADDCREPAGESVPYKHGGCVSGETGAQEGPVDSQEQPVECSQPVSTCIELSHKHGSSDGRYDSNAAASDTASSTTSRFNRSTAVQPNNKCNDYNCNNADDSSHYIVERHRHRYEVNPLYVEMIERKGLKFVGKSQDGLKMDVFELNDHPFFVGVQYHPEMTLNLDDGHPLFRYFLKSALQNKNN